MSITDKQLRGSERSNSISSAISTTSTVSQVSNLKRGCLLFPFVYLLAIPFEVLRNTFFFTPVSVISGYIFLINFPIFSFAIHSKPFYFEDLKDEEAIEDHLKERFQKDFLIMINIMLSFLLGFLTNYIIFQLHGSSLRWFELIGIFGGVLSLYFKFQNISGKVLIYYLQWKKQRERSLSSPDLYPHQTPIMEEELQI